MIDRAVDSPRPILIGGLSPAWQQTVRLRHFRPGQVNRALEVHWCASGKVLNVGQAVHRLGGPSLTIAPLGGPHGSAIEGEFDRLQAPARWIPCRSATRVCTTIVADDGGAATEVIENAGPLDVGVLREFVDLFASHAAVAPVAVLTGSLPEGTPRTLYRDLLTDSPVPVIADISGEELLYALEARPWVIKPNREELEGTIGRPLNSDAELIDAMRDLNGRGAEWVLVTQGTGAVWLTSREDSFRFEPLRVHVVNSIGCGDCLAAGMAWATREGRDIVDAVRFGLAAAAEKATQLLPARLAADAVAIRTSMVSYVRV